VWTFDAGTEGWQAVSMPDYGPYTALSGGPYGVTHEPGAGNPGGAISMTDPDGVTWFFSAPGAYLGNQLAAYGTSLSYDIRISYKSWEDADVALYGAGMSLAVDAGAEPDEGVWTHYSVNFDDVSGWKLGNLDGVAATEAQIKAVLADLQGLYIRGEYAIGPDYTYLDNVSFVPEPGASTFVAGLGVLAFIALRRRV